MGEASDTWEQMHREGMCPGMGHWLDTLCPELLGDLNLEER